MDIEKSVQFYYGKELKSSKDLKTTACCSPDAMPDHLKSIVSIIHEEVLLKYYGCGLIIPDELKGLNVLDLGCGAGRDCYILSNLVGENGSVTGVDMTPEQLSIAKSHVTYHMDAFNFKKPNIQFLNGNLEKLDVLNLSDSTFDVIVSNCVINLTNNKAKVLNDSYKLLKEGGEFYFSDVYCSRRIPKKLQEDEVLWGECLAGALYWNDFQNLAKQAGFKDPRIVESRELEMDNPEIADKLKGYKFFSVTYRLFKLDSLEPACEDYGQAVRYKGTMPNKETTFQLDDHHLFEAGKMEPVCGNSFDMLQQTRFANHFDFFGNTTTHYGIFPDCGTVIPYEQNSYVENSGNSACC